MKFLRSLAVRVALVYAVFGVAWIAATDRIVEALFPNPAVQATIQTYKGWFFVLCSTALIFVVLSTAVRARERAQERYRELFEQDIAGSFVASAAGRLLACNPAFLRIFQLKTREDALGAPIERLFSDPRQATELLDRLEREGRLERLELDMRRGDGSVAHVLANVTARRDEAGRFEGFQGYVFDDTDRRELQEQLLQTQKLESLGTLAMGVAHDFNNILAIVLGYSSLLSEPSIDRPTLAKGIETIRAAAERGAAIVRTLLTFARKDHAQFQPVDLNRIVAEVSSVLRQTIPKTIDVTTSLAPELSTVEADPAQIHQALLNLCLNARDAMPHGGSLSIATDTVAPELAAPKLGRKTTLAHARVKIADTGFGMDEKTRQRMFEPFFTTKPRGQGTGLGLSLVYSVVTSHHGAIDVASAPGSGTTVELYFPIPAAAGAAVPGEAPRPSDARGSETLLVIEDEAMLRELLTELLGGHGYSVVAAGDGEEGVARFASERARIGAVIADLGLPRMSGREVVQRIRALDPFMRIIAVSGYFDQAARADLERAGVAAFIQKPYAPDEVVRTVRTVLGEPHA